MKVQDRKGIGKNNWALNFKGVSLLLWVKQHCILEQPTPHMARKLKTDALKPWTVQPTFSVHLLIYFRLLPLFTDTCYILSDNSVSNEDNSLQLDNN